MLGLLLNILLGITSNVWSYGVMVSTSDFESGNPSSNLGRTYAFFQIMFFCYLSHLYDCCFKLIDTCFHL